MKLRFLKMDPKITTSKSFYVFIHYILWIWICDLINMFALFNNCEQDTLFINILAITIIGIVIKCDLRLFIFEKTDFKCLIGVGILGIIALMYAVYPDNNHDSWAYHYINQDPVWQGNAGFSYWENFYPLADRLFYLFRFLGGFKLGTLFNWVLLSLVYVQIIRIFKIVILKGKHPKKVNPYFMAFLCISLETVMIIYSTYMTDLTSAPLILEAIICLLLVVDKDYIDIADMVYFVFNLVFIFLMKLTTVVYIIPLLIIYLLLVRKSLTCKKFVQCCLLGILIVLPYLIYNYKITGMPFYPINVFSELAAVSNMNAGSSHDTRWGATNLIEIIFWPVIMALKPQYRHMEMVRMPNIYPLLTVCCGGGLLIKKAVKQEKDKKTTILLIVTLMSLYLWIISRTVDRYGVCAIILCGVTVVTYLYTSIESKIILAIGTLLFVFQAGCSYYSFMELGTNFKWPPKIETVAEDAIHSFFTSHYGRDRGSIVSNSKEYKYYVSPRKYANSYGKFLNEESILYDVFSLDDLPEYEKSMVYDEIYNLQQEGNYFYTASMEGGLDGSIQDIIMGLNEHGFKVINMELMQNTYLGNIVVYKSVLSETVNDLRIFSDGNMAQIDMEEGEEFTLKGLMFLSPKITWTNEPTAINFYIINENGDKEMILQKQISPGNVEHIDINIDIAKSYDSQLYIECDNKYGLDWDCVYVARY